MARTAAYDFDDFTNEMLSDEIVRAAREPLTRTSDYVQGLMAEAAKRLRDPSGSRAVPARYEVSVDGGEWGEPTEAVPVWAQDALANPYRTSITAAHGNGMTYAFRRARGN